MKSLRKTGPFLAVLGLAGILAGCSSKMAVHPSTPARDVLLSGETAPAGFGAYGYVVFTERPGAGDLERYLKMQDAFFRQLEPVGKYTSSSASWLMPTYWLAEEDFDKNSTDARIWIDKYDYARAKMIAASVSAASAKGPLLVAWSKPFEEAAGKEKALLLDLSDFAGEDLDRALRIWKDRITREPAVWSEGLNLNLAKEAFRNFLEKYGEHIIRAIEKVKSLARKNRAPLAA